jgi:hypothetical protein
MQHDWQLFPASRGSAGFVFKANCVVLVCWCGGVCTAEGLRFRLQRLVIKRRSASGLPFRVGYETLHWTRASEGWSGEQNLVVRGDRRRAMGLGMGGPRRRPNWRQSPPPPPISPHANSPTRNRGKAGESATRPARAAADAQAAIAAMDQEMASGASDA